MSKLFYFIFELIHKLFIQLGIGYFLYFKNGTINEFITLFLILMIKHPRHICHKCLRITNMIAPINNKFLVFANFFYLLINGHLIRVINSVKVFLNYLIFRCPEWHCVWNYFSKGEIKAAHLPRYITSEKVVWVIKACL